MCSSPASSSDRWYGEECRPQLSPSDLRHCYMSQTVIARSRSSHRARCALALPLPPRRQRVSPAFVGVSVVSVVSASTWPRRSKLRSTKARRSEIQRSADRKGTKLRLHMLHDRSERHGQRLPKFADRSRTLAEPFQQE